MSNAQIKFTPTTVIKTYPPEELDRWGRELFAYTNLAHSTPQLINAGHGWIEMERCTPVTALHPSETIKHRELLWGRLSHIHDVGYWHCDIDLVNVVIHPERGPLILDFENLTPASTTRSYDQWGAEAVGVQPAWRGKGPSGVWWGSPSPTSPMNWWRQA